MKLQKKYPVGGLWVVTAVSLAVSVCAGVDLAEVERLSKSGETLSADVAKEFPLREQRVRVPAGNRRPFA